MLLHKIAVWGVCVLSFCAVGCASSTTSELVRRNPAGYESNAGFTEEEKNLCWDFPCRQFVAPCSLTDPKRTTLLTLMEEKYLEEGENYREHGYCLRPPRQLSPEFYAKDTCLFIFVKQGHCP